MLLLEQVLRFIQTNDMISPGDKVIVAVSGGPDSVALLHVLHRLSAQLQITLHVFHLDHGLRGEESAEDARYVHELADRLGLPSTVVGIGPEVLKRRGGSLQAQARAVRLERLEALARRLGASKTAVGHNREDQAETMIMRFIRGSGLRGLAGISPVRRLGDQTIIRPLLSTPRQTIEAYCTQSELFPRLDASNLASDYLRNRIRLELVPQLTREYNPALVENLVLMANLLRIEDRFLDGLAAQAMERCRVAGEGMALQSQALMEEPLALARRVVRMASLAAVPGLDLGAEAVSKVLEVACRSEGTLRLALPGGLHVLAEYGVCHFMAKVPNQFEASLRDWPVALSGETHITELGLRIAADSSPSATGPWEATFDADRLPGPVSVRFRRPGDRMWLVGMDGSKKLQDILVDLKVPRRLRDHLPLLISGDQILWLIGYRLDRRFLATTTTNSPLRFLVSPKLSDT